MGKKRDKVNNVQDKDKGRPAKIINEQKNYALPTESSTSLSQKPGTDIRDELVGIHLNADLEAAMLDLIQRDGLLLDRKGRISQRLTSRKLTDMYKSLLAASFQPRHIEQAMTAVIAKGGDIVDVLDWLCLNLPDDQLPEGFSRTLRDEEQKCRRQRDNPQSAEVADAAVADSRRHGELKVKSSENETNKDWILRYAETAADEEVEPMDETGKSDEELDPNERYIELTAKLLDARSEISELKQTSADSQKLKSVGSKIADVVLEMKKLERCPKFDSRIKFENDSSPLKAEEKGAAVDQAALDETSWALFDESSPADATEDSSLTSLMSCSNVDCGWEPWNRAAATTARTSVSKVDRRSFTYTRQQWTGKSPKQFLTDWTRKHLPSSSTLSFDKIDAGGGLWRSRCRVTRKTKEGDVDVCPDIVCDNLKDAEHLASTLALYRLCPGQRIDTLLPPPYREVWQEWRNADDAAKKKVAADDVKPRDQFIARLLSSLKIEQDSSVSSVKRKDNDVCDSWEDRDSDEESDEDEEEVKETAVDSSDWAVIRSRLEELKAVLARNKQRSSYKQLLLERQRLPVYGHRNELVSVFRRENTFIVAGETGSGKSTQVPQFLLEEIIGSSSNVGYVLCTEPRRISAVSLAERVSAEMGEPSGPGKRDSLCGYRIRFESKCGRTSRLLYCTTGVVLRRLQNDPTLADVSCVIVDEVHERSVESDFLLIHLKHLLRSRTNLRVVLMSATLDAAKISSYFNGCPVINIPGKSFPVEIFHLEDIIAMTNYTLECDSPYALRQDQLVKVERSRLQVTGERGNVARHLVSWTKEDLSSIDQSGLDAEKYSLKTRNTVTRLNPKRVNIDLIVDLLHFIASSKTYSPIDGAILVFLPGFVHIQTLYDLLESDRLFGDPKRYSILVLHSALSAGEQSKVFITPPHGVRKIVLATNIAETGVTIPDVAFVIDSGRVKESQYAESTGMSQLVEVPISRASAEQRRGRAGRVRDGYCFRLFTRDAYGRFANYSIPEILRVPLEELCLHVMKCDLGSPVVFLNAAMDPPAVSAVSRAMSILGEVGACYWDDDKPFLTPLGHHLASLPIDVRLGKMLVYAAILGCLKPAAIVAASMMDKSPFATSFEKRDRSETAKSRLTENDSDHLTLYRAFVGWLAAKKASRAAERDYCEKNSLKRSCLVEIDNVSRDLMRMMKASGFGTHLNDMLATWKSPKLSAAFCQSTSSEPFGESLSPGLAAILKAALVAGLYPQLARVSYRPPVDAAADPTRQACAAQTMQGEAQIHPSSVNRFLAANGWVVYHEKVKSSVNVYLRDVTLVGACPVLLFGGNIDIQHQRHTVTVDGWISFNAPAKTGVLFKHIRYLIDRLLQQKIENPTMNLADQSLIHLLIELLVSEADGQR